MIPTHEPAPALTPCPRRGFTLIELLLVIGILALLFAIVLPALNLVRRQADATRTSALLASIGTALDAYKSDFGDIPRLSRDDPNFPNPLNSAPDRGARLLARALFGPAPANDPRGTHVFTPAQIQAYEDQNKSAFQDGHGTVEAPFGFKESREIVQRAGEATSHYPGEVHQPYLDPEKFELRKIESPVPPDNYPFDANAALRAADAKFVYGVDTVILDPQNQQPVLYYAGLAKQPTITQPATRMVAARPTDPDLPFPAQNAEVGLFVDGYWGDQPQQSLYNGFDNLGWLRPPPDGRRWPGLAMDDPDQAVNKTLFSFRELLGDANQNGFIDAGETAVTTGPYLLIAGGVDGFGLNSDSGTPVWLVTSPIANFDVSHTK